MRNPVMTKSEATPAIAAVNELFSKSPDGLREIVRAVMQEMLEAEMTDALMAEKGERTSARLGCRSGYYTRTLITRVGKDEAPSLASFEVITIGPRDPLARPGARALFCLIPS